MELKMYSSQSFDAIINSSLDQKKNIKEEVGENKANS